MYPIELYAAGSLFRDCVPCCRIVAGNGSNGGLRERGAAPGEADMAFDEEEREHAVYTTPCQYLNVFRKTTIIIRCQL